MDSTKKQAPAVVDFNKLYSQFKCSHILSYLFDHNRLASKSAASLRDFQDNYDDVQESKYPDVVALFPPYLHSIEAFTAYHIERYGNRYYSPYWCAVEPNNDDDQLDAKELIVPNEVMAWMKTHQKKD